MHNSLVTPHLRGYVESVFQDIFFAYRRPKEWARDKARLLHELENNGIRILTIALPALCKHFDKCLSRGLYTNSNLYLGGQIRTGTPVFLRDLYQQIFSKEGVLVKDPSVDAVTVLRQLLLGLKRLRVPYQQRGLVNEVQDFIATESGCRHPTLGWEYDEPLSESGKHVCFSDFFEEETSSDTRKIVRNLSRLSDRISATFGIFDPLGLEDRIIPKHGPGVVADLTKSETKYVFRDWPKKLDTIFPYDYFASTALGAERLIGRELTFRNREAPSRMIAVPKEHGKPRLIAAEPSYHQWIQQLVKSQLEAWVSTSWLSRVVHFRDQSENQKFALKGSIDGCYATIDLSSASDRLSCAVVERFFRNQPTFLDALHACRTRWLRVKIPGIEERYLKLKKFAPMGAADTFPVQSLVYAVCAVATLITVRGQKLGKHSIDEAAEQIRVFGDDIIVPTDVCRPLLELLTFLGLKVNSSKTFFEGNFRESCGVDAFKGYNVTPVRVLDVPKAASMGDYASRMAQANNLWRAGWWNLSKWVESFLVLYGRNTPIVHVASVSVGLSSFCGDQISNLRSRWNADLQRREVLGLVIRSKVTRVPADGNIALFQYFTERPAPDTHWEQGSIRNTVSYTRPGWVHLPS